MIECAVYHSPIGRIKIIESDGLLERIILPGDTFEEDKCQKSESIAECSVLRLAVCWLEAYFAGQDSSAAEIPYRLAGTAFQRCVWNIVSRIPYGSVTSYGHIAKIAAERLHKTKVSAQAVGNAVANNPLPILIPCHRVIGADGGLTGFSAGLELKKKLLSCENIFLTPQQKVSSKYFHTIKCP